MKLFRKNNTPKATPTTRITISTNYYTIGLDSEKSKEFCQMINEFFGLRENEHLVSIHASKDNPGIVEIETIAYKG